ncbi:Gfo/Idh/MocA family protein [Fictibacillus fluitans]|uniref:Gfo/Idh/MocA family oxidoreductase n=1 Tax=Fictibacillus fluitans TaxID=3058422 RepID=A0ABT8HQ36_9BACL|nr:Gfo/Idh/MocA family oxidoreductase [Fictibacillus sp. NE201]MDN4522874.1 Gfo/Idh/MocA family oxidoreductase [Fictibacillus sp. NE201]
MIQAAMLSRWHVHADDYAREAKNNPYLSIRMVWDEEEERGEKWAQELGVAFEKDLEAILKNPEIDAVIVNTPTNRHREVILAAIAHKKHVFTEKVLALTTAECEEIYDAAENAGIKLMVSLPRLTSDYYLYAQHALDQGMLGELTSVRCRLAHNGAVPADGSKHGWLPEHFFDKKACGGGALIDLGAHPIYLTNRLAGSAKSVTSIFQQSSGREVEENATVLIQYESGALGTIETGFLSECSPFQLELYGTKGALLIEENQVRMNSRSSGKDGWVIPDELPEALPMPLEQWAASIVKDEKPTITRKDVCELTLINEAAEKSNREGRRILVSEMKEVQFNH